MLVAMFWTPCVVFVVRRCREAPWVRWRWRCSMRDKWSSACAAGGSHARILWCERTLQISTVIYLIGELIERRSIWRHNRASFRRSTLTCKEKFVLARKCKRITVLISSYAWYLKSMQTSVRGGGHFRGASIRWNTWNSIRLDGTNTNYFQEWKDGWVNGWMKALPTSSITEVSLLALN